MKDLAAAAAADMILEDELGVGSTVPCCRTIVGDIIVGDVSGCG
jgi:hypothetical protein